MADTAFTIHPFHQYQAETHPQISHISLSLACMPSVRDIPVISSLYPIMFPLYSPYIPIFPHYIRIPSPIHNRLSQIA